MCASGMWSHHTLSLHIMRRSRHLRSHSTLVQAGATPKPSMSPLAGGLRSVPTTEIVLAAESRIVFMYFLPQRIIQSHHTFLFVLKNNWAWCFVLVAATPAWGAMCTSWADGHGRAGGGWIRQGDARRSRWGLLCARQRLTWSVKVEDTASPCPVDLCRRNLDLLSGHSVVSLP